MSSSPTSAAAHLRQLAEAATDPDDGGWYNADYLGAFIDEDDVRVFNPGDAAYIAALNPTVALLLADVVDAAEALIRAEDAVRDSINGQGHPGRPHDDALYMGGPIRDTFGDCATCGGAQYGAEDTKNTAVANLRVLLGHEALPFEFPTVTALAKLQEVMP